MSVPVIRGVRVFDGVSERAIERASVVVEGARIREVVVGAATPPRDARMLDGGGGTVLPGFVDMHSHLVSELGARLYLANGVTTVRFAGNDPDAVLALREAVEAARVPGPRVFSLGPLLDGISPDYPAMSWPLYSATEARLAVQVRRLTDDQGDPKGAAAVAQKFASDGSIPAVLYACAIECRVRTG